MLNPFYGEMNDDACCPRTAPASDRVQFDHQCSRSLGFVCPLPLVVCAVCVLQRSTAPSRPRRSTNECARSETSISDECRETRRSLAILHAARLRLCASRSRLRSAALQPISRPLRRTAANRPRAVLELSRPLFNIRSFSCSSHTVQP